MHYQAEYEFMKTFLENLHVNISTLDATGLANSSSTQFGVYSLIYSRESIERYYAHILSTYQERVLYKVNAILSCVYYVIILPGDKKNACIIGPFTEQAITEKDIHAFMSKAGINEDLYNSLANFYSSLRKIENINTLQTLLNTFMCTVWGGMDQFEMQEAGLPSFNHLLEVNNNNEDTSASETITNMRLLQERYEVENSLLRAISKGELHSAEMEAAKFQSMQTAENRVADPIRNMKNYAIIYNTLFRKAAEQGRVHPLYINQISSQFALRIESCRTMEDITQLTKEMIRKYCLLVKNHSMTNYSLLLQRALTIINGDLKADLSLSTLAEELNVNASYLSTQFKKEVGETLTDYVTKKRIEHAVLLLNSSDYPIATVAEQCGIPDIQYFSKIFKKRIGYSPNVYRKMIRQTS